MGAYTDDIEAALAKEREQFSATLRNTLLVAGLVSLAIAVLLTVFLVFYLRGMLISPLRRLVAFSSKVAQGDLDAVVVRDAASARQALAALFAQGERAAARVVVGQAGGLSAVGRDFEIPSHLTPLLSLVAVSDVFAPAAQRLLGHVFLAETLDDVPADIPAGCSVVTRGGAIFHADGCAELWMPDNQVSSPLARRMLVATPRSSSPRWRSGWPRIAPVWSSSTRSGELALLINQTRQELDGTAARPRRPRASTRRSAATRTARAAGGGGQELGSLAEQHRRRRRDARGVDRRAAELTSERNGPAGKIAEQSVLVQELESVYGELSHVLTECRIRCRASRSSSNTRRRSAIRSRRGSTNSSAQSRGAAAA
jgi:chromosome segregation ATPase